MRLFQIASAPDHLVRHLRHLRSAGKMAGDHTLPAEALD